jgi:hypothetical protein
MPLLNLSGGLNVNNQRALTLFFLACAIAFIPLFAWIYEKHSSEQFSCVSQASVYQDKKSVIVSENYIFRGTDGVVETAGTFTDTDGSKIPISRKFEFSYTQKGDEYTLLSRGDLEKPTERLLLRSIVPDFFMLSHRGVTVTIKKQMQNGYVFLMDNIPMFYCEKN